MFGLGLVKFIAGGCLSLPVILSLPVLLSLQFLVGRKGGIDGAKGRGKGRTLGSCQNEGSYTASDAHDHCAVRPPGHRSPHGSR